MVEERGQNSCVRLFKRSHNFDFGLTCYSRLHLDIESPGEETR